MKVLKLVETVEYELGSIFVRYENDPNSFIQHVAH